MKFHSGRPYTPVTSVVRPALLVLEFSSSQLPKARTPTYSPPPNHSTGVRYATSKSTPLANCEFTLMYTASTIEIRLRLGLMVLGGPSRVISAQRSTSSSRWQPETTDCGV